MRPERTRESGARAAVFAAILLCASCSSDDDPTPLIDFAATISNTTPFQRALIEDRHVDAGEYEKAILATWDCVRGQGFAPDDPAWENGKLGFETALEAPDQAGLAVLQAKLDDTLTACEAEYSSDVALVWVSQMVLSDADRKEARPDVILCLQDRGIAVGADAQDDEIFAAMSPAEAERWSPCVEAFPGYFVSMPQHKE